MLSTELLASKKPLSMRSDDFPYLMVPDDKSQNLSQSYLVAPDEKSEKFRQQKLLIISLASTFPYFGLGKGRCGFKGILPNSEPSLIFGL